MSGIKSYRSYITFSLQVLIIISSLALAYGLRFDFDVPSRFIERALMLSPAVITIKLVVFWRMGLFRGWWQYVSMSDLITIFKANLFASLGFLLYAVLWYRLDVIPRTIFLLDGICCFLLMGGIRFFTRAFRENYFPMPFAKKSKKKRVVVVGAGDAGQSIVREARQNTDLGLEVVGFIDDDPKKKGQKFQGVPVLGLSDDIRNICNFRGIEEVIVAIPSATGAEVRRIVEQCQETEVKFKILPGVGDLLDGRVSIQNVRDVDLEDLLGRELVRLDLEEIKAYLKGKRVLVTGAGGSIGSEICRQVAKFAPALLVLFENAETPLFNIENELVARYPELLLSPIIGDIRNKSRVSAIFSEFSPEVVFHAAAYKHVPMMELNPAEAVNNNIKGTQVLADTAHAVGVHHFVMISTDKAVNPTNVMGATKRVAELYIQGLARRSKTNFVTVRFGNVLGSNGSVIPTFKAQISNGGPVTVTHKDVTRFFMTIPEAAQLVLQAGSMGKGGEIFLLDMGEPVKILQLAEELIRLSGFIPYEDIDIVFTGLRAGEKLYEELLSDGEGVKATTHEKICVAKAEEYDSDLLSRRLEVLFGYSKAVQLRKIMETLQEIVPGYVPDYHGGRKKPQSGNFS